MNPKVIAFLIIMLLAAGAAYWFAEERYEAAPPLPDTASASVQ